jgi:cytochrome b pre-mRNA-processing protein 3
MFKKHDPFLYNTLLSLSRDIFFYEKIKLKDNFETRVYLMFMHFSIMMIVSKKRGEKFDQKSYDNLFHNIENNLRELGFGDVSVNKKMKELNKVLYDILIKIELISKNENEFVIDHKLISKYFFELNDLKSDIYIDFKTYFSNFYDFCFEIPLNNMVREAINFKK